ncbi:MAG: glycosyltransferase [Bacteroidota bacterium]|nr:glycosyltransferase [Bacteroidota bacterium]
MTWETNSAKQMVSVLITAFNREKYIAEAIQSVIDSNYSNWELIIVDDCSKDNTVSIAREFSKRDARIRVYVNERNLGDYANRNRAASYGKGKYLKYLDSDDKIFSDGLAYCIRNMEENPTASIGLVTFNKKYGTNPILISSKEIIKNHFFGGAELTMGPTGAIIKRDCFEKINGFDTRFNVASDNFFNVKMATIGDVVLLPYQFFYYREHNGQERHNSTGYLIHNYLYNKELFCKTRLPLSADERMFLEKKLQKRHSVNLVKYFFKTKSIISVIKVMRSTNYSLLKFGKSFFY